jgi:RNA polymerase sigma-70 factor (ECF subfamily)
MAADRQTFAPARRSKEIGDQPVHAQATTDTLLARCVAGDGGAWRELHLALYPAAAAFLRQMGVGPEDLDDAAQDVFLQVFRFLPQFEGRAELKTWIYKICLSQASRMRRKRTIRRTLERLLGTAVAPTISNVDGDWGGTQARREMEQALEKMSLPQRMVFVLYELHGLPGDQIARVVGCPAATVRGRLREARRIFSRVLTETAVRDQGSEERP